jgi:hypothetical protein
LCGHFFFENVCLCRMMINDFLETLDVSLKCLTINENNMIAFPVLKKQIWFLYHRKKYLAQKTVFSIFPEYLKKKAYFFNFPKRSLIWPLFQNTT